jgi:DNA-binding beta-propeller fold protein YncE
MEISTGVVTTIAGVPGVSGTTDGIGTAARFWAPSGITIDGTNIYITDQNCGTVRKIEISTGVVTTIAGNPSLAGSVDGIGTAAIFFYPRGVTTDGTNLYVADAGNCEIRKIVILTGAVTTLAGTEYNCGHVDGIGTAAKLSSPSGITSDGINLFVSDSYNNTIRKIQ